METHSKHLSVVILTDDKKGHFNQSWAVAKLLPHAKLRVISIHYQSKARQLLLFLLTYIPCPKILIPFFLICALKKDSYQKIVSAFCQMVISTGSSLNAPNLFLSKLKSAKSVVVMKPAWGWKSAYDLQIIPKHDTSSFFYFKRSNTVITLGAPTLIDEKDLEENAKKLVPQLQQPWVNDPWVSVFIGGNSSHHTLTIPALHSFIQKLNTVIQQKNIHLLITTSRRTPADISQCLKNTFLNHPRCRLLTIASEVSLQPEHLISGMMGLAQVILVTEDSISMISEAASSGKKVIVVQTNNAHKKIKSKHGKFIQELAQKGYITPTPLPILDQVIIQKLESPNPPKVLNDRNSIQQALARLL